MKKSLSVLVALLALLSALPLFVACAGSGAKIVEDVEYRQDWLAANRTRGVFYENLGYDPEDEDGQDEVIGMVVVNKPEVETIMVVSENGYGKRSQVEDYRMTNRGGKGVKTLSITEKTGRLVAIKVVTDDNDLMIINKSGILIRLKVSDCRVMGRATQGVRLINLSKKNDVIASVCKVMSSELEATVEEESRAQWTQKQEDIAEDIVSGTVSESEESKE